jgi:hypothetical protein
VPTLYTGTGTPSGPLDIDESGALAGSRLKVGHLGAPGHAHHIVSFRDLCLNSANGLFIFRRNATAGNPTTGFTDEVVIDGNGMRVTGTFSATTKQFDIPHPVDPEHLRLVHASIEGAEHAVYYRGEGQLESGSAVVRLPEYFEALSREQGRTVQVTPLADDEGPISALAASAVRNGSFTVRALDGANPQQRFYWEVKAVRSDIHPLVVEVPASTRVQEVAEPALV